MMVVKGKQYRTNLQGTLQLRVIRQVKREYGIGWATIQTYMKALDDEALLGDLLGDDEFLAWMWAWILNAGDTMTRSELEQLTVDDVEFTQTDRPDVGEPPAPPDPRTAPAATPRSARGGAGAKAKASKRTPASTKTSTKRSTPASR